MKKATFGLDENVASAATYLLGWLTGVVFLLVEKENKTVRFHAIQSIITFLGLTILYWIFSGAFWYGWGTMFALMSFVSFLISLIVLALWLVLMYKAYQGEKFKLPIVGSIAEGQAA